MFETCYFSPRLSRWTSKDCEKDSKEDSVLVILRSWVYPIVIYKYKKPKKIIGIWIGKECCKYFKENIKLNNILRKIKLIQGDVKKKGYKTLENYICYHGKPNWRQFLE